MAAIADLRDKLSDHVLVKIGTSFSDGNLDAAILAAWRRLNREARLVRTQTDVAIANGDSSEDLSATISGFSDDLLVAPLKITTAGGNVHALEFISPQQLVDLRAGTTATGRPQLCSFIQSETLELFPTADAAFTLNVPHVDMGTSSVVPVPVHYEDDLLWYGARAYLLRSTPGGKGNPDVAVMREFEAYIQRVKSRPRVSGPSGSFGYRHSAYSRRGGLPRPPI